MDKKTTAAPWGRIPSALDLRKLFDKLDLPDVGRKIVDAQRKDIEALIEANREAYRALEALGRRQQEILRAALDAWREGAKDVLAAPKLAGKAQTAARRSEQAFGRALTDLRGLTELVLESNRRVLGVLDARVKARFGDAGKSSVEILDTLDDVTDVLPKAKSAVRRKTVVRRVAKAAPVDRKSRAAAATA